MQLDNSSEDIETTAILPALDLRILSATLERVEQPNTNAEQAATSPAPEWKLTDRLAELQDQVASLKAAFRESENRYSRLTARHAALLQKLEDREHHFAGKQLELTQAQDKLLILEQGLRRISSDTVSLKQLMADSIQQRKQREQFILKQAVEIKRLRKLLP